MVIARIYAGLGNQLFQYAAAKALSIRLQVPLKLDITSFQTDQLCTYDLPFFNIDAEIASEDEIRRYTSLPRNFLSNIYYRLNNRLLKPINRHALINENCYHYANELAKATRNAYVTGLWQSEKYFIEYRSIILQQFTLKNPEAENRVALVNLIRQTNSVSITIRRGDYLKHPELNLYGNELAYYYRALRHIQDWVPNPYFFIFSDDIEWVKKNLVMEVNQFIYVSEPCGGDLYKINPIRHLDLLLLSYCKHHIITNSTFAWWGAWMSNYVKKIVIAPEQWFGANFILYNQQPNTADVIPHGWIKVK